MALTISAPGGPTDLQGVQQPRICAIPPFVSSAGVEAVELSRMAKLHLDPWEEFTLANSLNERANGRWAAFEVGVMVSRQNGKGTILEGRELAGLFILDERLLIHSAHQFDTSLEAFRRLLMLIEDCPDLERRVQRVSRSHGEEGIELKKNPKTGLRQRIRFRTRTKGGGRGFSGDFLALDEAMELAESGHGALLPTLSARPNPQVFYMGSAVDQEVHDNGIVFARIRERGIRGDDPALMYVEWSHDAPDPESVTHEQATDPQVWARANPGLGIRISSEHVEREQRSMDPRTFAVERLGVGDWPITDPSGAMVIDLDLWRQRRDLESVIDGPVCLVYDVRPNRSHAAIGAAGRRADGKWHVEVIDHRPGTGWVAPRMKELRDNHDVTLIACDGKSPAAALLAQFEELDVDVELLDAGDQAKACGELFDAVAQDELRHLGTNELEAALKGAAQRPLGDAWAWSRKTSTVDISPLVAITLALHQAIGNTTETEPLIAWR
jgi:hypothetical protein